MSSITPFDLLAIGQFNRDAFEPFVVQCFAGRILYTDAPNDLFQMLEHIVQHAGGRCTLLVATLHIAVDEQVLLLRLRNIGGLIIADFIDMKSRKDQQAVFNLMKERLRRDKAKTHVLPISQLGLMEMTRQRAQESLSDTIYENCPYCGGRGVVKTSMTTSVELHRSLNTVMRKYQDSVHDFRVILNPDVLKRLK